MGDLSKKDVRLAVREALSNANIPSEKRIREIVQEELNRQKEIQEKEANQGILNTIRNINSNPNFWKIILRYVVLFIFFGVISLCMIIFKIGLTNKPNTPYIKNWIVYIAIMAASLFLASALLIFVFKIYDSLKEQKVKTLKLFFALIVIFWLQIIDPDMANIMQVFF